MDGSADRIQRREHRLRRGRQPDKLFGAQPELEPCAETVGLRQKHVQLQRIGNPDEKEQHHVYAGRQQNPAGESERRHADLLLRRGGPYGLPVRRSGLLLPEEPAGRYHRDNQRGRHGAGKLQL